MKSGRNGGEPEIKRQLIGVAMVVGLVALASGGILLSLGAPPAAQSAGEALRSATVQIDLYVPSSANGREKLYATRLGTLVRAGGESLIITHDRWGPVLDGGSKARFSTTDKRMLVELGGAALVALIRHRDGGTMVLEAPEVLVVRRPWAPRLEPVVVGDGEAVQPGDTVTVAYRLPAAGRQAVGAFEALVQSREMKDGRPVWRLQSTLGEQAIPGDSGGGIWKDGALVGNLWACVIETVYSSATPEGEDVTTDRSVGAVLGAGDLANSVPADDPATVQPGRSSADDGRVPSGMQAG